MSHHHKDDIYAIMEWDVERFGVGIRQIDEQHRFLLSIINNLCRTTNQIVNDPESLTPVNARKRNQNLPDRHLNSYLQKGSRVGAYLDDLVTYCAKHLLAEEFLLETHGYADRAGHAAEHETLVAEAARAHRLCEEGNLEIVDVNRLIHFLRRWMTEHIPRDRRFAPLLLDKGFGA